MAAITRKRALIGGGILVAVLAVAVGGFLWWFFRDDAPDAVDLETAIEANTASTTTTATTDAGTEPPDTAAETTTTTAPAREGVEGAWRVDTSIGEFDFDSATGSFAGFRIEEELTGIGATEAVGRTGDVSGTMQIEGTTLTATEVTVDYTTLTTDDSRRDSRVQAALDTDAFPTGTFVLTQPVDLGPAAVDGSPVSIEATGELTIHGVTRPATFAIDAQLVDGVVFVVGTTQIAFVDYDVTVPSSPIVLSVSDVGTVEFQLLFTPA